MQITNMQPAGHLGVFDTIDELVEYHAPVKDKNVGPIHWQGGMSASKAADAAYRGHQPSIDASEEYLAEFESMTFVSRKFTTVNALAGGAPNVGALLAGSPIAMRRRQRDVSEQAPLNIFYDVGCSNNGSAAAQAMRGAASFGLARMLSATRSVRLFAVSGWCRQEGPQYNDAIVVRLSLDDLSRAAFMMAHAAAQRALVYGVIRNRWHNTTPGSWMFGSIQGHREHGLRVFADAVSVPVAESMYVPPPIYTTNGKPILEWLKDMLAKYGVAEREED